MDPYGEIQVVDRGGWQKLYRLEKAITQIGSDPRSDIVLDASRGGGVEGRHVQIICWSAAEQGYRLVNLANTGIAVGKDGAQVLAPRSATEVEDGDTFTIGEFSLSLRLSGDHDAHGYHPARTVEPEGQCIGLDVVLSMTQLAPNRTVEGAIVLRNLGDHDNVQFELDLEGLPSECYDIEPAPMLFAGAEQRVLLRLHHTGKQPIAGMRTIEIHASAPRSYVCEEAVVRRSIEVLPYYHYGLRWGEDKTAALDDALALPDPESDTPRESILVRWWQRLKELFARKPAALPAPASPEPETMETESLPPVLEKTPETEEKPKAADVEVLFATPEAMAEPVQDAADSLLDEPLPSPEAEAAPIAPREPLEHGSVWVGLESEFGPPKVETPVVESGASESEMGTSVAAPDRAIVSDRPVPPKAPAAGEVERLSDALMMAVPEPEALVVEDAHETLSTVDRDVVRDALEDEPVGVTGEARPVGQPADLGVSDDTTFDSEEEVRASEAEREATVEEAVDDEGWWEDEPRSGTWWTSDRPVEPAREEPVQFRSVRVVKAKVEPVETEPETGDLPSIEPIDAGNDDDWWTPEPESDVEMEE